MLSKLRHPIYNVVRHSSERTFQFRPSKYVNAILKDYFHYYILLGCIPLGGIIGYANIFYGPAKLKDIPEGYDPKIYEYHKNPISRAISYCIPPPEQTHEWSIQALRDIMNKQRVRLLEQKVNRLMRDKDDTKSWHFVPIESTKDDDVILMRQKRTNEAFPASFKSDN
ncbi:hypothetical protein SNEBB_003117 [Seison nebaliae]|nr:hypothetical protein SNEBB_003117 [Seison nebaliae]